MGKSAFISEEEKKKYAFWLMQVPGFGQRMKKAVFSSVSSAKELFDMERGELKKIKGLTDGDIFHIIEAKKAFPGQEERYLALKDQKIGFTCMESMDYPEKFREIADSPYGLFFKGRLPNAEGLQVGIVGARMCSDYGRGMAEAIAKELALCQVPVISGMARGIDAAGHRGALAAGGDTYAVFGCGVDVCYPNFHKQLYYEIIRHGGVLSEFALGEKPLAMHFPMRNRLISALSDVVLIIEAKQKSGSLITADFALEQGKDIYALPGRVTDRLSDGCNRLISQGAGVVLSVEDFLEELSLEASRKQKSKNSKKLTLEKDEALVYSCFGLLPVHLDEVLAVTGLDLQAASRILAVLQSRQLIEEIHRNQYKKTDNG